MRTPNLKPLPQPDRADSIHDFLTVFAEHPNLVEFRRLFRAPQDRQFALFAALERAVIVGIPAVSPPQPDDQADQILCDLLDIIDSHPQLKNHASYYGPHRYLANLQAFGVWRGNAPIAQPSARELFTTAFANLTAGPLTGLPASQPNNSPGPQDCSPNGELISAESNAQAISDQPFCSPQTIDGVLVLSLSPESQVPRAPSNPAGIIHHEDQTPGEKRLVGWDQASSEAAGPPTPLAEIPARPVRRGRPIKLDDIAKGRLLGLMSYGLSFRQAAAQLGVHHVTLLNALKRDEEFAQQVSEARLSAISQPLMTVIQASRTSWRAAAGHRRSAVVAPNSSMAAARITTKVHPKSASSAGRRIHEISYEPACTRYSHAPCDFVILAACFGDASKDCDRPLYCLFPAAFSQRLFRASPAASTVFSRPCP